MRRISIIIIIVVAILIGCTIVAHETLAYSDRVDVHMFKTEAVYHPTAFRFTCVTDPLWFEEWIGDKPYVYRGSCYHATTKSGTTQTLRYRTQELIDFVEKETQEIFVERKKELDRIEEAKRLLIEAGFSIN